MALEKHTKTDMKKIIIATLALAFMVTGQTAYAQEVPDSLETSGAQAQKHPRSNMTVKEWKVDAATNQKILDHVTIYNEIGKKVEEIEYDLKGQKWRKRYEHGANGKVARELVYNHANKLDNIRKYEYDELGRRKTEYIYDAKGRLKRYKMYEYIPGTDE